MKFLLILVTCLATLTVKAQDDVERSSFYGDYKGIAKTETKKGTSISTTSKTVIFSIAKGEGEDEIKLTLKGYQIGKYELKDFDLPNMYLQKRNGKWVIWQESNDYVDVESKENTGNTTFSLLVLIGDPEELTKDGSLNMDITFIWNEASLMVKFSGKRDVNTGISKTYAQKKTQEQIVYDLHGRRVKHPRKGLYIVDGKKVIIR